MTTTAHDTHGPDDVPAPHGSHEHPAFLAHHFETPQQQFDSGKLGIWLFLTTEILLFSGLFCAYSVYGATHPEIFAYAHRYLNKGYGALNTIVLIFSSFTMAWAVSASQTANEVFIFKIGKKPVFQIMNRKLCSILLGITIVCGCIFMCIKGVEYHDKWEENLLPGAHYNPDRRPGETEAGNTQKEMPAAQLKADIKSGAVLSPAAAAAVPVTPAAAAPDAATITAPTTRISDAGFIVEQSAVPLAAVGPSGVADEWAKEESARLASKHPPVKSEEVGPEPHNTHIFFGIYFLMTGLHGIHVLAGMALIGWVLIRNNRGEFGPEYFTPVDFVGLYWHIVDLIWIFLFPLLYLIGNTP